MPRDSYDLLAQSIERVIRSDLPPPPTEEQLAGAIDRIMLEEARGGELRLAYLRVLIVAPLVALTLWPFLREGVTGATAAMGLSAVASVAWLGMSGALLVALRRGWYAHWVPHVLPFVSAAMILAVFVPSFAFAASGLAGSGPEVLGYVTALCGFLCLSGALRLSRSSARTGIALAVIVFVIVAISARMHPLPAAAIVIALAGTGLLSASVTNLVRRVVTDEVAKATLSRMYHHAEESIDAREQVLKIVSHDLRNPLHTISMCASLLLDVPLSAEQQAVHLKRVKRAGERMNRLIQDLLDVAKLEAGRVAISAREMDVVPLLDEACDMLTPLAQEKSIRLDRDVAERLPRITADAGRVMQVLSNLVGNAIKFTPEGGRIVIGAKPVPSGVQFSVSDTGPGIPPDQVARIFGRFWQADAGDRRGIGLGLTIAKGIMDAHGGRLWVESQLGEGTTFHFVLGTVMPSPRETRERRRRDTIEAARRHGSHPDPATLSGDPKPQHVV
jgi:signal transduction histidine kinase